MAGAEFSTAQLRQRLRAGMVIPAHPLALTAERKLDEKYQRALTRYYLSAGSSGVAVGVHTTQFQIRDPNIGLFKPVLELAAETSRQAEIDLRREVFRIAGICGRTDQAVQEATLARDLGYHIGLLSLGAMKAANDDELVAHAKAVSEVIPIMGFYLQPSVGGRLLSCDFWRKFAAIENLLAIKMAPFNRYQTIDVIRAVAEAGRADDVVLYTGNDDNILLDLLTRFDFQGPTKLISQRVHGGLLGHWSVWTKKAVDLLTEIKPIVKENRPIPQALLTRAIQITDSNAAFFDPSHNFHGCIAGLHEVLVRQGLMRGRWCLDPAEDLSPGQKEEIDRVYQAYPALNDDAFVAENRDAWLA
ncbi:MAG: dihydrodipicolinate synthase family protein [Planctomycetota bacterium]